MREWELRTTPRRGYWTRASTTAPWTILGADKRRIVSVTEVLRSDGMADWAAGAAMRAAEWAAGEPLVERARQSGLMPDQVRDRAGREGTAAHAYLAARLRVDAELPPCRPGHRFAIDRFLSTEAAEPLAIELAVGDYTRTVAGTCDALVWIGGRLHMLDLKTSTSVRPEHWAQVAAYERMSVSYVHVVSILHIDRLGNYKLLSSGVGSRKHAAALRLFDARHEAYIAAKELAR